MKRFRLLILLGGVLLIGGHSFTLWAKQKDCKQVEKEKKELSIQRKINDKDFVIEVDRALPLSGSAVNLTSSYSLSIKGECIESHLPYFGRAYSVPYGGQGGLRFESTMSDYSMTYTDKGDAKISFKTRTDDDSYNFRIEIFMNGTARISITPTNKQGITYQGYIIEDEG